MTVANCPLASYMLRACLRSVRLNGRFFRHDHRSIPLKSSASSMKSSPIASLLSQPNLYPLSLASLGRHSYYNHTPLTDYCATRPISTTSSSTTSSSSSSSSSTPPRKEAPAAVPLATVEVRSGRAPKATYIQKADAAQDFGLQVRDLRAVDPSFRSQAAAILPRESGIIINLAHVRLIILPDRVLVFDPLNPAVEMFIPRLQSRLNTPGHPMPFEFRAMEAVLVDVCSSFNSTISTLIPSLDVVLDTLSTTTDFGGGTVQNCMDRLLPLENALNEFSAKVSQARDALNEVLSSDEDMSLMYLSTYKETGHRRRVDQHDEVEMMLENYVKQLDTIDSEVTSALRAVKTTETATQIRLDAMRNRVLRLDVFLNLGAVSLGTGGLVAGAFGMNLTSGFEEDAIAFWLVSGIAVITSTLCFRGVLAYLRYTRMFQ